MSEETPPALGERLRRQIERLLDEADEAIVRRDWDALRDSAGAILRLDPQNQDARAYLAAAERDASSPGAHAASPTPSPVATGEGGAVAQGAAEGSSSLTTGPTSFVDGRYVVERLLGEGGKKRVYLAHDTKLDRDVAFALIKTEGLDDDGRTRIHREAQAMGRLGDHPHIVSVYDIGEEAASSAGQGQPYIVSQLMAGGDVESLIAQAPEHLPFARTLKIADEVCQALEYAHGKEVIHRDLKPGNVWLTSDGTAKLGDFGLAVALDRSRLTQAGMMVGTVAYMAPEQASGGEVTPRSDLYSLGCLLYELVTGRPPFVGDDSVAIIGQHLNTPPVAPTWHRPDCPGGLEALIMRLLEKDPAQRPASAAEVRQLLASAAQGQAVTAPPPAGEGAGVGSSSPTPAGDPLYRQTFVGRESEVRQLRSAFDGATSGRGALMMVVGEPGIGKTALCEQLATYVGLRGGKTLVGHCYEEGSLSLPYLAFVEALRSYVLGREPDKLKEELGTGASDVARIVSEIRDRVAVELRPPGDPEDDRWRLFQAVTGFLRNASAVQPLVVVLEDLHWADRGTLDLLLHIARNLTGSRLLIIGTYRDVEVDRAHPLSATLAELRRVADFGRVPLRGLTVDEVHRMMNIIRGQEVPWDRAELIHRQTEGNPLFVQEVLRYLVEAGLLVREAGRYVLSEAGAEAGIPEGLRDVIGRRLTRLSEKTNQVLSIAAVVGREFRLDVLQKVASMTEDEIDAALQEAIERAILEQRPALGVLAFRFTHAFFRQTLYEEIFASRRLRLHQQVARGLEEVYGRRLEEHASELAEHFAQSTDPADLQKALAYSELAAKRALSVFAYGEAARHLEQALKIQDVLDPDDQLKRCDLLLALGEAMLPMEEPRRIADTVAEEAFALAEAMGDSGRAARAAVEALEALFNAFGAGEERGQSPEFAAWTIRADLHAQIGTAERVYADIAQASLVQLTTRQPAAGHIHRRQAAERAFALEDPSPFFAVAPAVLGGMTALGDRALYERVVHEVGNRKQDGVRTRDLGISLKQVAPAQLRFGSRSLAESAWRELEQLAERTRHTQIGVMALDGPVFLALLDGRLDEAIALHAALRTRAGEVGTAAPALLRPPLLLGRGSELMEDFGGSGRVIESARAVILAHLGRSDEARDICQRFGDVGSDHDESGLHVLVNLLEASVLSRDEEITRGLTRRLAPLSGETNVYAASYMNLVSIGRLLGDSAQLLGDPAQAHDYYTEALAAAEKIRFRPEIALIRLSLAELLLEHYADERTDALEHLDFSIKEFEAMKMAPSLERALTLRSSLKP